MGICILGQGNGSGQYIGIGYLGGVLYGFGLSSWIGLERFDRAVMG